MKPIPTTEKVPIIRTDFSDPSRWAELVSAAQEPPEPFIANFELIDDPAFQGKEAGTFLTLLPKEYPHPVLFLADKRALSEDDFPCIALDLVERGGRTFRASARVLASIENNLSIANMGFEEFEQAAAAEGVFRGFE